MISPTELSPQWPIENFPLAPGTVLLLAVGLPGQIPCLQTFLNLLDNLLLSVEFQFSSLLLYSNWCLQVKHSSDWEMVGEMFDAVRPLASYKPAGEARRDEVKINHRRLIIS